MFGIQTITTSNLLPYITVNKSLKDFYFILEDIITNNNSSFINYTRDTVYTNINKYITPEKTIVFNNTFP